MCVILTAGDSALSADGVHFLLPLSLCLGGQRGQCPAAFLQQRVCGHLIHCLLGSSAQILPGIHHLPAAGHVPASAEEPASVLQVWSHLQEDCARDHYVWGM